MNKLFDIFNVRVDKRTESPNEPFPPEQLPFGAMLQEQKLVLDEAFTFVSEMRKRGPKNPDTLPCQKGLLLNCRALPVLYEQLQELFPTREILICTMNFNQDCLERFFGVIRAMGAANISPNALQFKYRMRRYLLLKNPELLIKNSSNNVELEEIEAVNLAGMVTLKYYNYECEIKLLY